MHRRLEHIRCTVFASVALTAALSTNAWPHSFDDAFRTQAKEQSSGATNAGTIEVHTAERKLYFIREDGSAISYTVGVGRAGKQWFGSTSVVRKALRPSWSPPAMMAAHRPDAVIPSGSQQNPMGAAALVLADQELAIHGTNDPGSIGKFVSWGCIRMHNRDIQDLYSRVRVGTRVIIKR